MTNLLKETNEDIISSGHSIADIVFIGSEKTGHRCTWNEFCLLADQEYDSGYGAVHVATDLIIVFKDGSKLWREEYDGSERWIYSTPFKMPYINLSIKKLVSNDSMWDDLSEMNKQGEDYV